MQTVNDLVGIADPVDYYKFTLTVRSNFGAILNGLTRNADLELLNTAGTVLVRSTKLGTAAESINQVLDAATYYIRVLRTER